MKAGFFETDITPSIGMEQPGGYGKMYIKSFHDALKVRAAVFSDGKETVALVGVDSCVIQAKLVNVVRRKVSGCTGIKESAIMMGASHTHAGGPLFGASAEDFADAPEFVRNLALNESTAIDPLYFDYVAGQSVTAICEAYRRMQDASLSCGSGYEDQVAFNRRLRVKQGRVYTHPGKGNPDIIGFAGPVDPEVGVLSAWDREGKLMGCVINYACHGTTNYGAVTADWIYHLEKRIRGAMNRDAVVVFLNGASGDITQVNNLSMSEREVGDKYSDFVGSRVAAEAIKVMVTAEKGSLEPVASASRVLRLKRRKPSGNRMDEAMKIVSVSREKTVNNSDWVFAKELLLADYLVSKNPVAGVEVQAVQVGPAVFLANPAEYFCHLGLKIKKASPFPLTWVVELANGSVGYVPGRAAYRETGGGYETVLTSYSNLETGAGEKIVKASVELAGSLNPGQLPERPRAQKGSPWNYGVLGPDRE